MMPGIMQAPLSMEHYRELLVIVMAGYAAQKVILGRPSYPDGSNSEITYAVAMHELCQTRPRAARSDLKAAYDMSVAMGLNINEGCLHWTAAREVAEKLIRSMLWVPIMTAASVLYDHRHLTQEQMRSVWCVTMPDEHPWAVSYAAELDTLWQDALAASRPKINRPRG
ncbi:MAG: hypothetical protein H3C27_01065 [Opitutaceae bacterium]|nr:hypothetical protein [Opitutaceae bacterium]